MEGDITFLKESYGDLHKTGKGERYVLWDVFTCFPTPFTC